MPHRLILDLPDFCARRERHEGKLAAAEMPRFAAEIIDGGIFDWQVQGGLVARQDAPGFAGRPTLSLVVSGNARVCCARCLQPVDLQLKVERRYIALDSELEADEALADDERFDAVVVSCAFDLGALIEDELLMALPPTAHHEACPPQALADLGLEVKDGAVARQAVVESPFNILQALKKH